MFNTPTDCYNYIIENDFEMPVLGAMMNHVGGYSIAEIADGRFHNRDEAVSFSSPGYKINIPVTDDEIVTAVLNGLYVSAFISRNQDKYQIHFLVSGYPKTFSRPLYEQRNFAKSNSHEEHSLSLGSIRVICQSSEIITLLSDKSPWQNETFATITSFMFESIASTLSYDSDE